MYNHLGAVHLYHTGPINECVVCSLQDMCQRYWNDPNRPNPIALVSDHDAAVMHQGTLGSSFEDATSYDQGDAHDFMEYLKHVLTLVEKPKVNRLLTMRHRSEWLCPSCSGQYHSEEAEMGLMLVVADNQNNTLQTMIADDHSDTIDWTCDSAQCQDMGLQKCNRTRRIIQAPEILVVKLSRVNFDKSGHHKIHAPVDFPMALNLNAHTQNQTPLDYDLYGVVSHAGNHQQGHYIASVRTRTGHFRTVDDRIVRPGNLNLPQLQRPRVDGIAFDPVVLFYVKR